MAFLENYASFFLRMLFLFSISVFMGCVSAKNLDKGTIRDADGVIDIVTVRQNDIPIRNVKEIKRPITVGLALRDSLFPKPPKDFLEPDYPVAKKIVTNYLESNNKEPGGHCLTASKSRFLKAYEEVYGHSVYKDLPESIATKYYTPKQVFDHLYASTSSRHNDWRTLPRKYRGKGNAGAIARAGMGELVNGKGVWSGELRPGAPMQVWWHKKDYRHVVRGISDPKLDPYGHSFIFLRYVRDTDDEIIGIKIADQGYQSYRTVVPRDYEVWWGVNLEI